MAEQNNSSNSRNGNKIQDLAYEPVGMPTERVLRMQRERAIPKTPQVEIKRHKNIPVDALVQDYLDNNQKNQNIQNNCTDTTSVLSTQNAHSDIFRYSRRRMVQEQLIARGITDKYVLKAMGSIPRHLFVSEALHATAYTDRPLPIASGQTISQPYVVAFMCQLLLAEPPMRVLEIGTGSGYQAAVLHEMGLKVFSVERIKNLYENTMAFLKQELCYRSMNLILSDGTLGWERNAPYDRIIVAAGGPNIPQALKDQLAEGGVMLIPVGDERKKQRIIRVFKINGQCREEDCGPVSFVDLVGTDGWQKQ